MAKTVPESKFTEWKGLDRIQTTVHEMRCVWRELTKDDYGIDGEIEVVVEKQDGKGYETLGNVLKVQSKSGNKYVRFDTPTNFASPVTSDDLVGWNNSRYPVLYIVYHPTDDKLYAKEVRSYVKNTPAAFKVPCKIVFDKKTDEFTADFFKEVKKYADVSEPRVSLKQKEELYSNLFLVRRLPQVFHASTTYTSVSAIREEAKGHLPPIAIVEDRLFSFADLRNTDTGLRRFCDGDVERLSAGEWIANDAERQNDYTYMLNQLIGKITHGRGLLYNKEYERNYFGRPNDRKLREWQVGWYNVRTKRKVEPRTVVKYYEYGKFYFWRHLACHLSFLRLGDDWCLRIIPKYFFTIDGERPCEKELVGPYTTRIKAMEWNPQVLNHVLFWSDFLARSQDQIKYAVEDRTVIAIDREPLRGVAPFAIPDDPAMYEEKPPSTQMNLFNLANVPGMDKGGDDDED